MGLTDHVRHVERHVDVEVFHHGDAAVGCPGKQHVATLLSQSTSAVFQMNLGGESVNQPGCFWGFDW